LASPILTLEQTMPQRFGQYGPIIGNFLAFFRFPFGNFVCRGKSGVGSAPGTAARRRAMARPEAMPCISAFVRVPSAQGGRLRTGLPARICPFAWDKRRHLTGG
jgi:hypothetical protein